MDTTDERQAAKEAVRRYLAWDCGSINASPEDLVVEEVLPDRPGEVAEYVRASVWSYVAYENCVRWIERELECGRPLPPALVAFSVDLMRGRRKPPGGGRGRPKGRQMARDFTIAEAVAEALAAAPALRATRNDETAHRASACDIVRDVLVEDFCRVFEYSTVKRIWLESKQCSDAAKRPC